MAGSEQEKILIRNMVCNRCVMAVENILNQLGIPFNKVMLGEAELTEKLSAGQCKALEAELRKVGFDLIESRVNKIVEDIKKLVLEYITGRVDSRRRKLSSFITEQLHYDYSYLSDLFSSIEGTTLEQYFIVQRIEKVKELIVYEEQSLTEIAFDLGFSSVHHLSSQFKKVTGLTPSHFKKIGAAKRKSAG